MSDEPHFYDPRSIAFLEEMWGPGYLSPGGPEEVARVLAGLDLRGKTVIDIGCGAGGATISLVRDHGALTVIGVDVEEALCAAARERAANFGVTTQVEIWKVRPGPLPVPDRSVDMVFSKDSIVHIADKEGLAADVFRVLKPGGWFAASDWLISHDGPPSPAMQTYIDAEALGFGMAGPLRYEAALAAAGFTDIRFVNRNPWYLGQAREELARLTGPDRDRFAVVIGARALQRQITTWTAMIAVLETGEHCPHHFRARKPD